MSSEWLVAPNKYVYGYDFGADGVDYIDANFVDTFGNSIAGFLDDGEVDYIRVEAGTGDDLFSYYNTDYPPSEDTIEAHGNDGNDSLETSAYGEVLLFGDDGDDQLTAQFAGAMGEGWPGAPVQMTGGEGADVFRSMSFSFIDSPRVVITDFEVGIDRIEVMNEGEAWEVLDLAGGGNFYGARFNSEQTAEGVELRVVHYENWSSGGYEIGATVTTYELRGLTLDDLNGATLLGNRLIGTEGRDRFRSETIDANGNGLTDLADTIEAGGGPDSIRLDTSGDVILAGDGDDFVLVRGSGNTIDGGAGNDQILTRWGGNTVDGGAGDDRITVDLRSGGDFEVTGGDGADTFIFTNANAKAETYTEITDFDIFQDQLIIGGVEIDLDNLPADFEVVDNGSSMMLEFGRNDSMLITFDIYPM